MAKFLATKRITAELEDIIQKVQQRLVLISPYVQVSPLFSERLRAAGNRGVKTILVCREQTLKEEQKKILMAIPGLLLLTHDNVHAKSYYNEQRLILGSMNFYDHSDQNNREMGVLIDRTDDPVLFGEAVRESEEIIGMAQRSGKTYDYNQNSWSSQAEQKQRQAVNTPQNTGNKPKNQPQVNWQPNNGGFFGKLANVFRHQGYCIRCHAELQLNANAPFCTSCFKVWAQWENYDFEEKYCHCCGKSHATSRRKPLCLDCFRDGSW